MLPHYLFPLFLDPSARCRRRRIQESKDSTAKSKWRKTKKRPVRHRVSKGVEDDRRHGMAGSGETLGSPWIPLTIQACLKMAETSKSQELYQIEVDAHKRECDL
jgi:hypothetical protein